MSSKFPLFFWPQTSVCVRSFPMLQSLWSHYTKYMFFTKFAPNGLCDCAGSVPYVRQNCQLLKCGVLTIETTSFETYWFVTCSFETTFIWDRIYLKLVELRHVHLRPNSCETTLIWDCICLRPHLFETCSLENTFIWDYVETAFVWDHIDFVPHSFEIHIDLRSRSFAIAFTWDHLRHQLFWDYVYLRPAIRLQTWWSQI